MSLGVAAAAVATDPAGGPAHHAAAAVAPAAISVAVQNPAAAGADAKSPVSPVSPAPTGDEKDKADAAAAAAADDAVDVEVVAPATEAVRKAVDVISAKLSKWHCDRHDEKAIIDALRAADTQTLNGILLSLDCSKLVAKVDDRHHLLGPARRTELLTLLGTERVTELSLEARARLLVGLQRSRIVAAPPAALQTVLRIFTGVQGRALTHLKRRIDLLCATTDLHGLLWKSLSAADRDALLRHFNAQAQAMLTRAKAHADAAPNAAAPQHPASPKDAHGNALPAAPLRPAKVLSDIDDTLCCTLNDYSYPSGTVYPGIRQLYTQLDRGPGAGQGNAAGPGADGDDAAGDLVFLTARPSGGGHFRKYTYNALKGKYGVTTPFSILNGSLSTLFTNAGMASKKHSNFVEYRACYPEYRFVFTGDSGQGDVLLGQEMMRADRARDYELLLQHTAHDPKPDPLKATAAHAAAAVPGAGTTCVMIHDIVEKSGKPKTDAKGRAQLLADGIFLFDSYVSAALNAYRHQLISRDGLLAVATAASDDFKRIAFKDETQKTARLKELTEATAALHTHLEAEAKVAAAAAAAAPAAAAPAAPAPAAAAAAAAPAPAAPAAAAT